MPPSYIAILAPGKHHQQQTTAVGYDFCNNSVVWQLIDALTLNDASPNNTLLAVYGNIACVPAGGQGDRADVLCYKVQKCMFHGGAVNGW